VNLGHVCTMKVIGGGFGEVWSHAQRRNARQALPHIHVEEQRQQLTQASWMAHWVCWLGDKPEPLWDGRAGSHRRTFHV